MTSKRVDFFDRRGQLVEGRLQMPDGAWNQVALFAHSFPADGSTDCPARIAAALGRRAFAVLCVDVGKAYGGGGVSQSWFSVEFMSSACAYLSQHYATPGLILGHGIAGLAGLLASNHVSGLTSVVALSSPSDLQHMRHLIQGKGDAGADQVMLQFGADGASLRLGGLADWDQGSVEKALHHLKIPVLLMHATDDQLVGSDHALRLFHRANQPKSIVAVPAANSCFQRDEDAQFVADTIAAWAWRHCQDPGTPK